MNPLNLGTLLYLILTLSSIVFLLSTTLHSYGSGIFNNNLCSADINFQFFHEFFLRVRIASKIRIPSLANSSTNFGEYLFIISIFLKHTFSKSSLKFLANPIQGLLSQSIS
jgi:hypothetical protein